MSIYVRYEALDSFRDPALTDSGRQTMQAMVGCVSEGTGNVTRALKAAGMWETTLFLWSSDNGGPQYCTTRTLFYMYMCIYAHSLVYIYIYIYILGGLILFL